MIMGDTPLKVGLIGYGFAGRTFHAPVISAVPELQLTKVVERSSEKSKERYPHVEVVRDVQSLYADPDIDLVVVTTPSTDHYSFAKDALLAGKHVIVEKPFTTTSEEADELAVLAKQQGKVISVFHNRRWDGDYQTVRQVLGQGWLGRISEAEFRWDRYRPEVTAGRWRDAGDRLGSGVFYDLGVHLIDQALCLFGKPKAISADIRTQRDGAGADDAFEVTLSYADRLNVRLRSSLLVRQPGPRYSLYGTTGSFVKYGEDPQEDMLKAGLTPLDAGYGIEREDRHGTLDANMGGLRFSGQIQTLPGGYHHYFRNVAEHILGRAELEVKPEEARDAIRLIELGLASNKEKRTVNVEW
ncbi:oxidoreductase [Paenibacillus sp. LHD-117]|uniref:oxidoreductase n=1 Tax=Paenibacillus sp. LHD-117 TaxID=3071412 RepID=UPI0027DF7CDB|nr:oxidoreductase [Paenibacillus sp. LHD-117]MDQ6418149.1 oxidoreductase [Paenibacillus sp. LHD-117]